MIREEAVADFRALVTVPWDGDRQAWDQAAGQFAARLARQVGGKVTCARAEPGTGEDGGVCVGIHITVRSAAGEVAAIARQVYARAAGDDARWRGDRALIWVTPLP